MTFVKHRHDMMHRGQVPADQLAEGTPSPGDTPHYQYDGSVAWEPESGGGSDDQTAAEVPYDNSGSGLTASDVQDAIDELRTLMAQATSLHTDLSVSGALAIDYTDGATHDLTLTGNVTGVTISNALASKATDLRLVLRQDGSGNRTVTWTGITVTWVGGSAPTLQTGADAVDVIGLLSLDDGTTWLGFHAAGGGGGASALDDLTDVTITAAAEGDLLRYDGTAWVDTTLRPEPMIDSAGGVQLDSAGNPQMHEVAW